MSRIECLHLWNETKERKKTKKRNSCDEGTMDGTMVVHLFRGSITLKIQFADEIRIRTINALRHTTIKMNVFLFLLSFFFFFVAAERYGSAIRETHRRHRHMGSSSKTSNPFATIRTRNEKCKFANNLNENRHERYSAMASGAGLVVLESLLNSQITS